VKVLDQAPCEMVRFEGEFHGLSRGGKPANREERLKRILDWFQGEPWLSLALARQPERPGFVAPEISAGDEIQVLLGVEERLPGVTAVGILDRLTAVLRPHRIVFGLGLGTLSTEPIGSVQQLDGICFHRARAALAIAKRRRRWAFLLGGDDPDAAAGEDALAVSVSPGAAFQLATNAILRLTGEIRAGWTDRQVEVMRQFPYTMNDARLQKDVAEELDVSPSVISEILRAARRDAVREAEHAVAVLLNRAANPEPES
jgi:SatD family (SatD)